MRVGVINARFVKPLDHEIICKAIEECGFVLTIEEASLLGWIRLGRARVS